MYHRDSLIRGVLVACWLAVLMVSAGCGAPGWGGASAPADNAATYRNNPEFEVISQEEQSLAEIMATPSEFEVSFSSDSHAWERVKLFLEKYTSKMSLEAQARGSAVTRASNRFAEKDSYTYFVDRSSISGGYRYRVRCQPNAIQSDSQSAILNERNLSRFIQQGTLEVSLLRQ